jgi:hypothetical protein
MIIVRLLSPGLGWFAPPKFIPGLGAGIVMESITVKIHYSQNPHALIVTAPGPAPHPLRPNSKSTHPHSAPPRAPDNKGTPDPDTNEMSCDGLI